MTKPKYPLFFKAVDIEENTFALIFVESENKFTSIMHSANKFIIDKVATWEDVRMSIGGKILPIEPSEYNKILFSDWKIDFNFADQLDAEDAAPVFSPELDGGAPILEPSVESANETFIPPAPETAESIEAAEGVEDEGEANDEVSNEELEAESEAVSIEQDEESEEDFDAEFAKLEEEEKTS